MAETELLVQPASMRWAMVTPSYALDLERCTLLCRSMDRFLTGPWHHYIIVDPVDLPLFRPLASPRRSVINKKDILPKGFHFGGKVPFMRLGRWWWSFRHGPVFGWQMQQFVKIFMANHLEEEAIAFCDSDIFFIRPFDISRLGKDHKVRFFNLEKPETGRDPMIRGSIEILGLDPDKIRWFWGPDQLVTWHRPTVLAMQDFIAQRHGKPWHEAIGWKINFAEYHLYGCFVNYVQKDNPHIFPLNKVFCDGIWTKSQAKAEDIRAFCKNLRLPAVAVCIQSLIGMDMDFVISLYEDAVARHAEA